MRDDELAHDQLVDEGVPPANGNTGVLTPDSTMNLLLDGNRRFEMHNGKLKLLDYEPCGLSPEC